LLGKVRFSTIYCWSSFISGVFFGSLLLRSMFGASFPMGSLVSYV
jgi:hypothetical protein